MLKYHALISVILIHNICDIYYWTRFLQWLYQSAVYTESARVDSAYHNSNISAFYETVGYVRDPLLGCPKSKEGSIFTFFEYHYLYSVSPEGISQSDSLSISRNNSNTVWKRR